MSNDADQKIKEITDEELLSLGVCPCGSNTSLGCSVTGCPLYLTELDKEIKSKWQVRRDELAEEYAKVEFSSEHFTEAARITARLAFKAGFDADELVKLKAMMERRHTVFLNMQKSHKMKLESAYAQLEAMAEAIDECEWSIELERIYDSYKKWKAENT